MINIQIVNQLTLDGETWKQIPDYPNYMISNMGRLYSGFDNKICQGSYKNGYRLYELFNKSNRGNKHGDRKRASHLVAEAFIKWYKPEKHKHIHHINRTRDDDRVINLFPCTEQQHKAIHLLYDILAKNTDVLCELLRSLNIKVIFNDEQGGDAA